MSSITFDDGTDESFRGLLSHLRGWNVSLLSGDEQPQPSAIVPGVDVSVVSVAGEGLVVRDLDADSEPTGEPVCRPWDSFERVHVW